MNDPGETVTRPKFESGEREETVGRGDSSAALVHVLDQYLADVRAGRAPDRARILAENPGLAAQLEPCLAGIDFIHRAAGPNELGQAPTRLGDFQIVRELGRGGMGVVYEAEQTSLKRRVALKVLRFGVRVDEDAIDRFTREAEIVARLHHTNIVPIFAVGCESAVSYYAMQFIDGRSLADVAAEARDASRTLAVESVARWCLQAAEALTHAHHRGVIHRDVKPSNLLLDNEGVVWLTDFGLAKRADEVALTVSGAIMGTPRYMSPEQARAARQAVDHRTDIYSLGASLYELVTGQPVFDADTPHGVITQILNAEPVPPRRHLRTLPRDLETIILKCLHKEPARRYQTADALAEDLRSFLLGRSIRARRPSVAERLARLGRRYQRNAALVAAAAGISIAAMIGGSLGWRLYQESRLGRIDFKADSALSVEILDPESDRLATDPFTAPTRTSVALPEGTYRARVAGPGMLGATYSLQVVRGQKETYALNLDDRNLWDAPAKARFDLVRPLPAEGRTDLIVLGQATLRRLDGKTGRQVWENETIGDSLPPPLRLLHQPLDQTPFGTGADMVRPAPDLDGDGAPDIVWACRRSALLLACSGKTGAVLWGDHSRPKGGQSDVAIEGRVVGSPVPIDADGDGAPDLVATFATNEAGQNTNWVEAVSGRSGRTLWRLDPDSSTSAPAVVAVGGRTLVAVVTGSRWIAVDPKTGQEATPALEMKTAPDRAPCYADLDRDGSPDLITIGGSGPSGRVSAYSLVTRRLLWSLPSPFDRWLKARKGADADRIEADVPSIVDLDDDGRPEVIAPWSAVQQSRDYQTAGVQVVDGATGRVRWSHEAKVTTPIQRVDSPNHWFRDAPDLDRDGIRDVVEASIYRDTYSPGQSFLCIDVLSGRDGRTLWWWNHKLEEVVADQGVACLRWWQEGPDRRPQLIVGLKTSAAGTTFVLEGGSGRLVQTIASVPDPGMADLDGDGRPDLWGIHGNRLQAIRGTDPELWRWLGEWQTAADYDGDGVDDLVRNKRDYLTPTTSAISGRDGRLLWDADIDSGIRYSTAPYSSYKIGALRGPGADLDGDGTSDLYATKTQMATSGLAHPLKLPIAAISGKTGRTLWTPEAITTKTSGSAANVRGIDAADLDGDGRPEVLVCHELQYNNPAGRPLRCKQAWLTLLTGSDGSVRWHRRLDPEHDETKSYPANLFLHEIAELDGDGVRDVLLAQLVSADGISWSFDLRAMGGRTGRPLWSHRLAPSTRWSGSNFQYTAPRFFAGDLDGDGKAEVIIRQPADAQAASRRLEFAVLDGATGAKRWDWHKDGATDVVPIHLARLGREERRSIVMRIPDRQGKEEILVLDERGSVMQQRRNLAGSGLEVGDLDGDGTEEFVFFDGDTLHVTRGGCLDDLWSRDRVGTTMLQAFGEIRPASKQSPATIIANQRFGLEGTTGRLLWDSSPRGLLLDANNQHPGSLVVERSGDATLGRLVAPVPGGAGQQPMVTHDLGTDPRRIVPLPWVVSPTPVWQIFVGTALSSLGLLVLPGWLALRALRRPWRVASLLALPVACAAAYVLLRFLVLALPILDGTSGRLVPYPERTVAIMALYGLPGVALLVQLGTALWYRQWWRLAWWLGLSVVLAVLSAVLMFNLDSRLGPSDHYTWQGWPEAWYVGAFATGLLVIIGIPLKAIGTAGSRGVRRVLRYLEI